MRQCYRYYPLQNHFSFCHAVKRRSRDHEFELCGQHFQFWVYVRLLLLTSLTPQHTRHLVQCNQTYGLQINTALRIRKQCGCYRLPCSLAQIKPILNGRMSLYIHQQNLINVLEFMSDRCNHLYQITQIEQKIFQGVC